MIRCRAFLRPLAAACFFLILTGASALQADGQETAKAEEKILFVGNSFTFWWNLPQHVSVMMSERDRTLEAHQSTASGAKWSEHWQGEKELVTVDLIKQGSYDAVILQNHSMRPIEDLESFLSYGKKLHDLASSNGAEVFLFMTWPYKFDPYMYDDLAKGYYRLGEEMGAEVIPVGTAWKKAMELRPDLPIYDEDGRHPTALGTYLAACVIFSVLTEESPVGLPHRLVTKDANGQKLYLNIQSTRNALFCQKVAREVVFEKNEHLWRKE
jgi:hypothetical protein